MLDQHRTDQRNGRTESSFLELFKFEQIDSGEESLCLGAVNDPHHGIDESR